jgi:hypothetical protein
MNKLYVIVRSDINPGLQLAQSCHATEQFHRDHPELATWKNIVCLQAPSKEELARITDQAKVAGCVSSAFFEPDLDDELTAVALSEDAKRILSSLPLALRAA